MNDKKVWFDVDSSGLAEQKVANLLPQIAAFRELLSTTLALDDLQTTGNRR